jgi:integrase
MCLMSLYVLRRRRSVRNGYGRPFRYRIHFLQRLYDRTGVTRFGFHSIRHPTASTFYRLGHDVATVQAILRHKSPNTTECYLRSLGVEDVRHALNDLSVQKGAVFEFKPGHAVVASPRKISRLRTKSARY